MRTTNLTHLPDLHLLFLIPSRGFGGIQEATYKKLKKKAKPVITYHQSLDEECIMKAKIGRKEIIKTKLQGVLRDAQDEGGTTFVVLKKRKVHKREYSTELAGNKVLEEEAESDAESEDLMKQKESFDQLAKDRRMLERCKRIGKQKRDEKRKKEIVYSLREAKFLHETIASKRSSLLNKEFLQSESRPTNKNSAKRLNDDLNPTDLKKTRLKKRVVNETPRKEDMEKDLADKEVTEQGTKKRKSGHVKDDC
ncbi:hypothetical protein Tco_0638326 [Tanacetum coccineum]